MVSTPNEVSPPLERIGEPYPEPLTIKLPQKPGEGRLPSKEEIEARFQVCAWRKRLEEIEEEAAELVLVSTKIMMTDILEAATRLRRNHTVEGSGLAHSYGVIQDCRIYLFGEEPPAEPIARNKTRISARDMLEAIRFDKRLYLHTDLKQILKKQLDFVESPKPKKRKNTMEGEGPPAKNKPHP